MYLKNIEVHGFKSFAQKINFEFHNGITAIVGSTAAEKAMLVMRYAGFLENRVPSSSAAAICRTLFFRYRDEKASELRLRSDHTG